VTIAVSYTCQLLWSAFCGRVLESGEKGKDVIARMMSIHVSLFWVCLCVHGNSDSRQQRVYACLETSDTLRITLRNGRHTWSWNIFNYRIFCINKNRSGANVIALQLQPVLTVTTSPSANDKPNTQP
jgi:hypothetical protein